MDKVDFEFKINDKNYNEYFARFILETVYGEAFSDAKVMDRPDIWVESENGGIGVEVTTLLDIYYNTLKKYKKAWSKKGLTIEEIVKSVPSLLKNKLGINQYGNLILLNNEKRHTLAKSLKGLETTIRTKLHRLQHYKNFASLNLFIFATNLSPNCTVEKIMEMLAKIDKSKFPSVFDSIMIFNYDSIIVFPFGIDGQPEKYDLDEESINSCDKLAQEQQSRLAVEYDTRMKRKKEFLKQTKASQQKPKPKDRDFE